VADITYLPTWSGFEYLAVVIDDPSRRVVGWSMAGHLRTELIINALVAASGTPMTTRWPRASSLPWRPS
jgi:putative transposase